MIWKDVVELLMTTGCWVSLHVANPELMPRSNQLTFEVHGIKRQFCSDWGFDGSFFTNNHELVFNEGLGWVTHFALGCYEQGPGLLMMSGAIEHCFPMADHMTLMFKPGALRVRE